MCKSDRMQNLLAEFVNNRNARLKNELILLNKLRNELISDFGITLCYFEEEFRELFLKKILAPKLTIKGEISPQKISLFQVLKEQSSLNFNSN